MIVINDQGKDKVNNYTAVDIQVEALELVQVLLRLAKQVLIQQKYNIIR